MHLYALTVSEPAAVVCATFGSFSAVKAQEIVLASATSLALLRHDSNTDRMVEVSRTPVFGCIRSVIPFRLTGSEIGIRQSFSAYSFS
jgi:splicing factor 3B subunit 3